MKRIAVVLFAALVALSIAAPSCVRAEVGSFSVEPKVLYVTKDAPVTLVTVWNNSQAPKVIRVSASLWEQSGSERVTPSTDVIAFPAIFSLAPNESQVIRVTTRGPRSESERAYKFQIREVPPHLAATIKRGVAVGFAFTIGLFVEPDVAKQPILTWHATRVGTVVRLTATNSGTVHARVRSLHVTDPRGRDFGKSLNFGDVLAGSTMSQIVRMSPDTKQISIQASYNSATDKTVIPVGGP